MREKVLFFKKFLQKPNVTGALLPSSKQLAIQITRQLDQLDRSTPLRCLEIGPGSGVFSEHLLEKLGSRDRLDLVEIEPHFCKHLVSKFTQVPNLFIHESSILDFEADPYDLVISGLPLNSFSSALVSQILAKLERLVKPKGMLSYFEYIGLQKVKESYLPPKMRKDFQNTLRQKRKFNDKHCQEVDHIWWNLPPARVLHCQF